MGFVFTRAADAGDDVLEGVDFDVGGIAGENIGKGLCHIPLVPRDPARAAEGREPAGKEVGRLAGESGRRGSFFRLLRLRPGQQPLEGGGVGLPALPQQDADDRRPDVQRGFQDHLVLGEPDFRRHLLLVAGGGKAALPEKPEGPLVGPRHPEEQLVQLPVFPEDVQQHLHPVPPAAVGRQQVELPQLTGPVGVEAGRIHPDRLLAAADEEKAEVFLPLGLFFKPLGRLFGGLLFAVGGGGEGAAGPLPGLGVHLAQQRELPLPHRFVS